MKTFRVFLPVFLFLSFTPFLLGQVEWLPTSSSYDGTSFVQITNGVGALSLGLPSPTNPFGASIQLDQNLYAFGFATATIGSTGPTMSQTNLGSSALVAGTKLLLRFSKAANQEISFIAMIADASTLTNIGLKIISPTVFEVKATIVDPIISETNNPDNISSAFGMVIQATTTPDSVLNFKGTVFVTNMHYLDIDPPELSDLPQTSDTLAGFVTGITAHGITTASDTTKADFYAYIPEALFKFARDNGVNITGATCDGYRSFEDLATAQAPNGFFKLNDPDSVAFADANFDIDGDTNPDSIWRYKIHNEKWSIQKVAFGQMSSTVTGIELEETIPSNFILQQNYPNPFNPSTTIKFTLPTKSFVNIKIFNSLGQQIKELVNETLAAGSYRVNFNAKNISSGIYFYKIFAQSDDGQLFTATKKMILLK